jgi:glycerophosphoryl diester phosphodiesterase
MASIEIHGHRGARAVFPENSLAAFEYALELGVDYLELDVRVTRDNQLVIHHDPVVNPELCTRAGGEKIEQTLPLRSLTLAELKQFDCGSLPHPEFPSQRRRPGSRISSLRELFALVASSPHPNAATVRFHIELKAKPAEDVPPPAELARLLVPLVKEYGFLDRTVFQSFSLRYTRAANALARELGRMVAPKIISPKQEWLRGLKGRLLFKQLKNLGYKVVPWTANTPEDWRYLLELGVDGIVTDDPEALMKYLKITSP